MLTIKETGRGFELKSPYNEDLVKDLRGIQHAYWVKAKKHWFIPMHRERELEMLKKKWGVMVDPVIDLPEQLGVIPEMKELEVPIKLNRELFPFQRKGVQRGIDFRRFINGDAPGLGKSQQAIATAIATECKCILVICPATLKPNWRIEWDAVAGMDSLILGDKNKTSWTSFYEVGIYKVFIVNFESLKKFFVKPGWKKPKGDYMSKDIPLKECVNLFDCIIVDESHKAKDVNTLTAKLVLAVSRGKKVRQLLTGTPIVNKPRDLIAQLSIIGQLKYIVSHIPDTIDRKTGKPKDPTGMSRFINRYCDGGNGVSNSKELHTRLRQICFFRREKKEVLPDLPEKMRQLVYCDITNRDEYDLAEREFVKYLENIKGCNNEEQARKLRGGMMVKMGVLKNITAKGKLDAAHEYIGEVVGSGQKIVVFYHLLETLRALKSVYPNAAMIVGEDENGRQQRPDERQANIVRFQTDENCSEILCSLKAGGVGTTLHAAWEVLLIEQPWTDAAVEQAIDRVHRIGQTMKVRAGILLGRNTIDEYIYFNIIMKKRKISSDITGAEYVEDDIVDDLLNFFDKKMHEVK